MFSCVLTSVTIQQGLGCGHDLLVWKPEARIFRILALRQTPNNKRKLFVWKAQSQGLSELRGQLQSYQEAQRIPFLHRSSIRFCRGQERERGGGEKKAGKENRQYKVGVKTGSKLKPTY